MNPTRINVTGNDAAGKTTLARQIGAALNLPVLSLDSIVWQAGWRKTPPEERRILEQALIEKPMWVIDGVSARIRQAADLVIFLDASRRTCAWRGVKGLCDTSTAPGQSFRPTARSGESCRACSRSFGGSPRP